MSNRFAFDKIISLRFDKDNLDQYPSLFPNTYPNRAGGDGRDGGRGGNGGQDKGGREKEKEGGFLKKFLASHLTSQQRNHDEDDKNKLNKGGDKGRGGSSTVLQHYQPQLELFPPVSLTPCDQLYAPVVDYTDPASITIQSHTLGPQVSATYPQDFPHALLATVAMQHTTPPLTNPLVSAKEKAQLALSGGKGQNKVNSFQNQPEKFDIRMNLYPVDWLCLAIMQASARHDDLPLFYQYYQGQSNQYLDSTPIDNHVDISRNDAPSSSLISPSPITTGTALISPSPITTSTTLTTNKDTQVHVLPPSYNLKQASLRAITSDPHRFKDHLSTFLPQTNRISEFCLYPNILHDGVSAFEHLALRSLRTGENKLVMAGEDSGMNTYNESLWYDFHSPLTTPIINQIRQSQSRIYRKQQHLNGKLVLSTLSQLTRNAIEILSPDQSSSGRSHVGPTSSSASTSNNLELNLRATQSLSRDSNLAYWSNNGMRIVLSHHQPLSFDAIVRKCLRVSYPPNLPQALPIADLFMNKGLMSIGASQQQQRSGSSAMVLNSGGTSSTTTTSSSSIHKVILPFHAHTPQPQSIMDLFPASMYNAGSTDSVNGGNGNGSNNGSNNSGHYTSPLFDQRDNHRPGSSTETRGGDNNGTPSSTSTTLQNANHHHHPLSQQQQQSLSPLQRYQNRGVFAIPNLRRINTHVTYSNWLLTLLAPMYCYYYDKLSNQQQQLQIPSPLLTSYLTYLSSNTRILDDLVWTSLSSHLLLYHLGVTPVAANSHVVLQSFMTNIAQRFIQSTFSKNIKRQSSQARRLSSTVGQG